MFTAIPVATFLVQKTADNRNLAVYDDPVKKNHQTTPIKVIIIPTKKPIVVSTVKQKPVSTISKGYIKPTEKPSIKYSVLPDSKTVVKTTPKSTSKHSILPTAKPPAKPTINTYDPNNYVCGSGGCYIRSTPRPIQSTIVPIPTNKPTILVPATIIYVDPVKKNYQTTPIKVTVAPTKIPTIIPTKYIPKPTIVSQQTIVQDLLKGDKNNLLLACSNGDKGEKDSCSTRSVESLVSSFLPEYKEKSSEIATIFLQNKIANDYLNKSNSQLVKDNCGGMSPDNCERLISGGGLLKSVGINDSDVTKLVTQKKAQTIINKYIATDLVNTTPIEYETEYKKAFSNCQNSRTPQNCSSQAAVIANTAVTNYNKTASVYTRSNESKALISACKDLKGENCDTSLTALDSLGKLSGVSDLSAVTIQADKAKITAETKAYQKNAGTLANLDQLDTLQKQVEAGTNSWVKIDQGLASQDIVTQKIISWNDFTAGRFKNGNDSLMSQYKNCTGNTINTCELVDNYDSKTIINGVLAQGGDAAMLAVAVVGAAIAAPIVGMAAAPAAFFGTGLGVAGSVQMIGMAGDVCQQAHEGLVPMSECDSSRNMAIISSAAIPIGLTSDAVRTVRAAQAISGISNVSKFNQVTVKVAEIGLDVFSSRTFTDMAVKTCNTPGVTDLDCASSVAMAITSTGKLVSNGLGVIANVSQINTIASVANAGLIGEKLMSGAHLASAGLFMGSACSKLSETQDLDTISMCSMGMSGAVQSTKGFVNTVKLPKILSQLEQAQTQLKISEAKIAEYEIKQQDIPSDLADNHQKLKTTVEELTAQSTKTEQIPLPTQAIQRPAAVADLLPPVVQTSFVNNIFKNLGDLISGKSGGSRQSVPIVADNKTNTIQSTIKIIEKNVPFSLSERQKSDLQTLANSQSPVAIINAGVGSGKSLVYTQAIVVEMAKPGQAVLQVFADKGFRDGAYQESSHSMYSQNGIDRFFYDREIGYRKAVGYENGQIIFENKVYNSAEVQSLVNKGKISILISDSDLRFGKQGSGVEAQGLTSIFDQSIRILDEGSKYTGAGNVYRTNQGDGIALTALKSNSTNLNLSYDQIIDVRQKVLRQNGSTISNIRDQVISNIKNGTSNRGLFDSSGTTLNNDTVTKVYRETVEAYSRENPKSTKAQELLKLSDSQLRETITRGVGLEPGLNVWLTAVHSEFDALVKVPNLDFAISSDGSYQVQKKGGTTGQTLSTVMEVMTGNETARQMYDAAQSRAGQPISAPLDLSTIKVYEQSLQSNGLEDILIAKGGKTIILDATPRLIEVGLGELAGAQIIGEATPMFTPREAFGANSARQAINDIVTTTNLSKSEYLSLREKTANQGKQLQRSSNNSLAFDQLIELKIEYSRLSKNEPNNPRLGEIQNQINDLNTKLPTVNSNDLNNYVENITVLRSSQNSHENVRILNNETSTLISDISTAIDTKFASRDHHIINPDANDFRVIIRGNPNQEISFTSIDQYKAYVEKEYYSNNAPKHPSDYVLEVQHRDTGLNLKYDANSHWIIVNDVTTTSQSATQGTGRDRFYAEIERKMGEAGKSPSVNNYESDIRAFLRENPQLGSAELIGSDQIVVGAKSGSLSSTDLKQIYDQNQLASEQNTRQQTKIAEIDIKVKEAILEAKDIEIANVEAQYKFNPLDVVLGGKQKALVEINTRYDGLIGEFSRESQIRSQAINENGAHGGLSLRSSFEVGQEKIKQVAEVLKTKVPSGYSEYSSKWQVGEQLPPGDSVTGINFAQSANFEARRTKANSLIAVYGLLEKNYTANDFPSNNRRGAQTLSDTVTTTTASTSKSSNKSPIAGLSVLSVSPYKSIYTNTFSPVLYINYLLNTNSYQNSPQYQLTQLKAKIDAGQLFTKTELDQALGKIKGLTPQQISIIKNGSVAQGLASVVPVTNNSNQNNARSQAVVAAARQGVANIPSTITTAKQVEEHVITVLATRQRAIASGIPFEEVSKISDLTILNQLIDEKTSLINNPQPLPTRGLTNSSNLNLNQGSIDFLNQIRQKAKTQFGKDFSIIEQNAVDVVIELRNNTLQNRSQNEILSDEEQGILTLSNMIRFFTSENLLNLNQGDDPQQVGAVINYLITRQKSIDKLRPIIDKSYQGINALIKKYSSNFKQSAVTFNPLYLNILFLDSDQTKQIHGNEKSAGFYAQEFNLLVLKDDDSFSNFQYQWFIDHELNHHLTQNNSLLSALYANIQKSNILSPLKWNILQWFSAATPFDLNKSKWYSFIFEGHNELLTYYTQQTRNIENSLPVIKASEISQRIGQTLEYNASFEVFEFEIKQDLIRKGYSETDAIKLILSLGPKGYQPLVDALGGWNKFFNYFKKYENIALGLENNNQQLLPTSALAQPQKQLILDQEFIKLNEEARQAGLTRFNGETNENLRNRIYDVNVFMNDLSMATVDRETQDDAYQLIIDAQKAGINFSNINMTPSFKKYYEKVILLQDIRNIRLSGRFPNLYQIISVDIRAFKTGLAADRFGEVFNVVKIYFSTHSPRSISTGLVESTFQRIGASSNGFADLFNDYIISPTPWNPNYGFDKRITELVMLFIRFWVFPPLSAVDIWQGISDYRSGNFSFLPQNTTTNSNNFFDTNFPAPWQKNMKFMERYDSFIVIIFHQMALTIISPYAILIDVTHLVVDIYQGNTDFRMIYPQFIDFVYDIRGIPRNVNISKWTITSDLAIARNEAVAAGIPRYVANQHTSVEELKRITDEKNVENYIASKMQPPIVSATVRPLIITNQAGRDVIDSIKSRLPQRSSTPIAPPTRINTSGYINLRKLARERGFSNSQINQANTIQKLVDLLNNKSRQNEFTPQITSRLKDFFKNKSKDIYGNFVGTLRIYLIRSKDFFKTYSPRIYMSIFLENISFDTGVDFDVYGQYFVDYIFAPSPLYFGNSYAQRLAMIIPRMFIYPIAPYMAIVDVWQSLSDFSNAQATLLPSYDKFTFNTFVSLILPAPWQQQLSQNDQVNHSVFLIGRYYFFPPLIVVDAVHYFIDLYLDKAIPLFVYPDSILVDSNLLPSIPGSNEFVTTRKNARDMGISALDINKCQDTACIQNLVAIRLNTSMLGEEIRVKEILKDQPQFDNGFFEITPDHRNHILDELKKYPERTPIQQQKIALHAIRVLSSLDPTGYILTSLNNISKINRSDLLHPDEADSVIASLIHILKQYSEDALLKSSDIQIQNTIIAAVVAKESYKFDMPQKMKATFIRLMESYTLGYKYDSNDVRDPINNLVVVKTGEKHLANKLGGGVINIEAKGHNDEQLGSSAFHEEIHVKMFNIFFQTFNRDYSLPELMQNYDEIVDEALTILHSRKVGIDPNLITSYYVQYSHDLSVILDSLQKQGKLNWDDEADREKLFMMNFNGDLSPLMEMYANGDEALAKRLIEHFSPIKNEIFADDFDGDYSQIERQFLQESSTLGLDKLYKQNFKVAPSENVLDLQSLQNDGIRYGISPNIVNALTSDQEVENLITNYLNVEGERTNLIRETGESNDAFFARINTANNRRTQSNPSIQKQINDTDHAINNITAGLKVVFDQMAENLSVVENIGRASIESDVAVDPVVWDSDVAKFTKPQTSQKSKPQIIEGEFMSDDKCSPGYSGCSVRSKTVESVLKQAQDKANSGDIAGALTLIDNVRKYINSHDYQNNLTQAQQNSDVEINHFSIVKTAAQQDDALLAITLALEEINNINNRTDLTPDQKNILNQTATELQSEQQNIQNTPVSESSPFEWAQTYFQRFSTTIRRHTSPLFSSSRQKEDDRIEKLQETSLSSAAALFTHKLIENEPIDLYMSEMISHKLVYLPPVKSEVVQRLHLYQEIKVLFDIYPTINSINIRNDNDDFSSIFSRTELGQLIAEIDKLQEELYKLVSQNDQSIVTPISGAKVIGGRYIISEKNNQAEGGQGVVSLAWDMVNQKTVSIKMSTLRDTIAQEAKYTASLKLMKTPYVYDLVTDEDGTNYFVMDYISGPTLVEYLDVIGDEINNDQKIIILRQFATEIDILHKTYVNGIAQYHGDMKPSNLIIHPTGLVLIDFGLAQPLNEGGLQGTPKYNISPKQIDSGLITQGNDLRAFSIIAYEVITNYQAFNLDEKNFESQILNNEWDPRHLLQMYVNSPIYPELFTFFDDCFGQKNNIDQRFPTAESRIQYLESMLKQYSVPKVSQPSPKSLNSDDTNVTRLDFSESQKNLDIEIFQESNLNVISSESLKTTRAELISNGKNLGFFILKQLRSIEAVRKYISDYQFLKDNGFPLPLEVFVLPGRENTIAATDLTNNGEFDIYSYNSQDIDIPNITKISNMEEIEVQLNEVAKKADSLNLIIPNDAYFIIINKNTGIARVYIGDLGSANTTKSDAISRYGYTATDTTLRLVNQYIVTIKSIMGTNATKSLLLPTSTQ